MPSEPRQDVDDQENPTSRRSVHDWIARRVGADEQMRRAGAAAGAEREWQD